MKIFTTLVTVLYPLIVYVCVSHQYHLGVALVLGALLAMKGFTGAKRRTGSNTLSILLSVATMSVIAPLVSRLPSSALYYPVAVNAFLLALFAGSRVMPPTLIERFARLRHRELSPQAVAYCRKVCDIWIVFLIANLALSLDSTRRSLEWWSLYNGALSYAAIALIFGIEYLIRQKVMKRSLAAVAFLIVTITSLPQPSMADPSLTLSQLASRLKPPSPFRAAFTEQRFVAVLTAPLESQGEIECIPEKGLVWRVTRPITKTSLITPSGVTILDAKNEPRVIPDRANISAALISLLSGDVTEAQSDFQVIPSGTEKAWVVTLFPHDSLVAEIIHSIVVSGGERPEKVEVVHANQDRIVTTFAEPVPLTPSEMSKAQALLHEAS